VKSWEGRPWAAAAFRDRVQSSILVLVGFSGQDEATTEILKEVFEDVYTANPGAGRPRLVVIDYEPDTQPLQDLISSGVGPGGAAEGAVTKISTASSSTTAVLMTLVTEMIALELEEGLQNVGHVLPSDHPERLALLGLAGPAMARWSFLLNNRLDHAFIQQVNTAMSAVLSYVPLSHDEPTSARALKLRHDLRERFGITGPERPEPKGDIDGFIEHQGRAYMPTGLDLDHMTGAYGREALAQAKDVLPWPRALSPVLVFREDGDLHGVSIETGRKVPVP
jgi:hypothetical protein